MDAEYYNEQIERYNKDKKVLYLALKQAVLEYDCIKGCCAVIDDICEKIAKDNTQIKCCKTALGEVAGCK